jgi:hypothetical protein
VLEVAAITLKDGEQAGYEFVEAGGAAERLSPLRYLHRQLFDHAQSSPSPIPLV